MAKLAHIVSFFDDLLRTRDVPDYDRALNGLQLENAGEVDAIAAAVDYSATTVRAAVQKGANLLLVHHGMFWSGLRPLRGHAREALAMLMAHDVAVYSSHLPLDAHPALGNNALLARELALTVSDGFARFQNIEVGVSGSAEVSTKSLLSRLDAFARTHGGSALATPFPPDHMTLRWGICTGAGADSSTIREAVERGLDTIIVGEGPHHTAVEARDLGLVILYAGHYATETLGVRALAEAAAHQFDLRASFIEAPTGL